MEAAGRSDESLTQSFERRRLRASERKKRFHLTIIDHLKGRVTKKVSLSLYGAAEKEEEEEEEEEERGRGEGGGKKGRNARYNDMVMRDFLISVCYWLGKKMTHCHKEASHWWTLFCIRKNVQVPVIGSDA